MSEKEGSKLYPLKSLHDFLLEIDKEWDRFRTASLIGIVTSGVLLFFLIIRLLTVLVRIRRSGLIGVFDEFVFLILVAAFVIYEITLLYGQYKFFKRWNRRLALLLHLEENLMEEKMAKPEDTASEP